MYYTTRPLMRAVRRRNETSQEEGREVAGWGFFTCLAASHRNELQLPGLNLLVITVCFAGVLSHRITSSSIRLGTCLLTNYFAALLSI